MQKVTVIKKIILSLLIDYYIENLNAQIFRTTEHERHG